MLAAFQLTDVGLVHHRAGHRNPAATESMTNLVQHTQDGFLGEVQIPVQLHRRHALEACHQKINCNCPLLQWHMGVLQQCAVTKRKMLAAVSAPVRQRFAALNLVGVGVAATETTCNTVFQDDRLKQFTCRGFIGKHLH